MNNRSFSPISHYLVRLYIDLHKLFFIAPQNHQIAISFIRSSDEKRDEKKELQGLYRKIMPRELQGLNEKNDYRAIVEK